MLLEAMASREATLFEEMEGRSTAYHELMAAREALFQKTVAAQEGKILQQQDRMTEVHRLLQQYMTQQRREQQRAVAAVQAAAADGDVTCAPGAARTAARTANSLPADDLSSDSAPDQQQLLQRLKMHELIAAQHIAQLREKNKELRDELDKERARGEAALAITRRTCDNRLDELTALHAAAVAVKDTAIAELENAAAATAANLQEAKAENAAWKAANAASEGRHVTPPAGEAAAAAASPVYDRAAAQECIEVDDGHHYVDEGFAGAPPPQRHVPAGHTAAAAAPPQRDDDQEPTQATQAPPAQWQCSLCRQLSSADERIVCVWCMQTYRCSSCGHIDKEEEFVRREHWGEARCRKCRQWTVIPQAQLGE
jgi:hypothetical protein